MMLSRLSILVALVLMPSLAACGSQRPAAIPSYASPSVTEGWDFAYRGRFSNGFQPVEFSLYTSKNADFSIPSELRDSLRTHGWLNRDSFDSPTFLLVRRDALCITVDDFEQSRVWVDLILRETPATRALQSTAGSVMRVMIYSCSR
jgi:hypothetical protein